jgi:transposase
MFIPSADVKVYLALGITDMRKSINGLSIIVEDHFELNPFSGNLFAFCNRKKTIMKILYWDRTGFCLWQKRLEKQTFKWPQFENELKSIGERELLWLIDGLDITQITPHETLKFESVN